MTESVLLDDAAARALFVARMRRGRSHAARLAAAARARAANAELGLALSDDEIDYLVEAFRGSAAIRPTSS